MLDRSHCCKLLGDKYMSIVAEDTNLVFCEKFAHGLSRGPGRCPHRCGSLIGEHQPCIMSANQVDTAGQFIQDQLQQGSSGFCLGMYALFDQQATCFCHIVPDDHSTGHSML